MTQKKSSARLNSSSDKRFNKDTKGQIYICPFFMFIFLLKGQKKNEPKRKNLFNVSLTLHWASLRGFRRLQTIQRLETLGIWLVPSGFSRNLI